MDLVGPEGGPGRAVTPGVTSGGLTEHEGPVGVPTPSR